MAHDERREIGTPDTITNTTDTAATSGERPLSHDEAKTVKAVSAPATAAAGAIAGATAGLVTGPFGPVAAIVGALGGAAVGAAVGAAGGQVATDAVYTGEDDAYYHALWDGGAGHPAGHTYDASRPAYQFGHLAAQHRDYHGRDFDAAEPELRRAWDADLRTQYGEWDAVRHYVHDAYGHARSLGHGVRRDTSVIGTAGSAVDPVELERARAGLRSTETRVAGDTAGDVADDVASDARGDARGDARSDVGGDEATTPAAGEISIVEAQREGREYI